MNLIRPKDTFSRYSMSVITDFVQAQYGILWNQNAVSILVKSKITTLFYLFMLMLTRLLLDDLNSYDRERSQALVVNLLLTYIKRNNSPALSKLVHSFCKIYLPFGYESRLSSSNSISKENNAHNNRRNRSKSLSGNNIEKKNSNSFLSNTIDTFFFSKANRVNRY